MVHAFGAEVGGPVGVEISVSLGKGDHLREVGEEGLWVVVPKLHVGVVEEAFEDGARRRWRFGYL